MMDYPHCLKVIYNNDLYGVVQCSYQRRSESYVQFLMLRRSLLGNVPLNVIYSFINVFQKQPSTCKRCSSSWADRVWCAGRRASCYVLMSVRGRPGAPPGQGTPEGNGGWFPGRHTRRSFRKRVCPRDEAGSLGSCVRVGVG